MRKKNGTTGPKTVTPAQAHGVANVRSVDVDDGHVLITTDKERTFAVPVSDVVVEWSKRLKWAPEGDSA